MYESEFTKFIREMKTAKPTLEAEQRQGRNLLWDCTPESLEELAKRRAASVAQQAYVYQTKG
jgi:hypothetical protein